MLGSAAYGESSRLLHLFCENEGKISLIARGISARKSKTATAAEAFNLVQITYSMKEGASLGQLNAIEIEEVYAGLRANLMSYALANYWCEILSASLQPRLRAQAIFRLSEEFLENLEGAEPVFDSLTTRLFLHLLDLLGYAVDFGHCGACMQNRRVEAIDLAHGYGVCRECIQPGHGVMKISQDLIQRLTHSTQSKATDSRDPLSPATAAEFVHLINRIFTTHLEHRFRSYDFLREVLAD